MTDSDLQPLYEAAYKLAGVLLGASVLNVPVAGDFSLDNTTTQYDFSNPSAACTSLTVMFCGCVAQSIYEIGQGNVPDYANLQNEAMADINPGDIPMADPFRQQAWQRASTIINSLVDRLDILAGDLVAGNPVDATHTSLQFGQLSDDSLDDEGTLTAMGGHVRKWANLAKCNLNEIGRASCRERVLASV